MDIELSQIILNNGLTFLIVVTTVVIGIIAYYLVKLMKDLSELAKNVNETSILLNTELKPTLKELNETLHAINSIVQSTDEGVGNMKTGIESLVTKTKAFSESIFGGFFKGFMTVYSLLKRK